MDNYLEDMKALALQNRTIAFSAMAPGLLSPRN